MTASVWQPWFSRAFSLAVAVALGSGLALAAWLEPDLDGHGTHQQLGLATCSILAWTGYPCPMCGMTTTFAAMMDGDLPFAFWNQPFGVVLFAASCGALGVALAELIYPRDRWVRLWRWFAPWESWAALAFVVGLVAAWLWKISIFQYQPL